MTDTSRLGRLRALLLDLDGVVYRGGEAMPGAVEFFELLRSRHLSFCLITNNSTRTPEQIVAKLKRFSIEATEEQVVTSAEATGDYLAATAPAKSRMLVIGSDALRSAVRRGRFGVAARHPDYVVVGLDVKVTYGKLRRGCIALRRGAAFIASNADATLPTEEGEIPGAGAIVAALQVASGVTPMIVGKPEPLMLEMAMRRLGLSRDETAVIGDRLETDIVAGQRLGITTMLVLTGVTRPDDILQSPVRPDFVFRTLAELGRGLEVALDIEAQNRHAAEDLSATG